MGTVGVVVLMNELFQRRTTMNEPLYESRLEQLCNYKNELLKLSKRGLDALIAEKVMNWYVSSGRGLCDRDRKPGDTSIGDVCEIIPSFSSSTRDDYIVLEHVRKTWNCDWQWSYCFKLEELHHQRRKDGKMKDGWLPTHTGLGAEYQPGDYSLAALLTVYQKNKENECH